MNKTLDYYNKNAEEYVLKSHNLPIQESLDNFLKDISPNSHILEIGTGSGRDAIYFSNKGYRVTTIEPSISLTEKAQELINKESLRPGLVQIFTTDWQNFQSSEKYDAIYAMASLLHLPKSEIKQAFEKCIDCLSDGGKLFISLKSGQGESIDPLGREFSYYEKDELKSLFKDISSVNSLVIDFDGKKDLLGRVNTQWINIDYVKPNPELTKTVVNKYKP